MESHFFYRWLLFPCSAHVAQLLSSLLHVKDPFGTISATTHLNDPATAGLEDMTCVQHAADLVQGLLSQTGLLATANLARCAECDV